MNSLFDKFVAPGTQFRPTTTAELFALRLSQRLKEPQTARHYATLVDRHSIGQLLYTYRRVLRNGHADLGRGFHKELEQIHSNGNHNNFIRLIAIRIERRTIAVAIFYGEQLEYTESRQLSSDNNRAFASAVGFVRWILSRFSAESAAVEAIAVGEYQRRLLHDGISELLRGQALPIWEIPKNALLDGCGHPPLKTRSELRRIATAIWPVLAGRRAKVFIQDAAILGLHVQIERLFIIS
jgi:hypothetical protein